MQSDTDEYIANITETVVQANDDRSHPWITRHSGCVLDRQSVVNMRTVLGIRGHCGSGLAGIQREIGRKQHHAGASVAAELNGFGKHKRL
jgi:hypothetical protein